MAKPLVRLAFISGVMEGRREVIPLLHRRDIRSRIIRFCTCIRGQRRSVLLNIDAQEMFEVGVSRHLQDKLAIRLK